MSVVGNAAGLQALREFLLAGSGAAVLHGPPGCGKSLALEVLAREQGYLLDVRCGSGAVGAGDAARGLMKRVLVIDGVEQAPAVKELVALVERAKVPVVFVCNDKSLPKLKPLLGCSLPIAFRRPTFVQARAYLRALFPSFSSSFLERCFEELGGDMRQVIAQCSLGSSASKEVVTKGPSGSSMGRMFGAVPHMFSKEPLELRLQHFFIDYSLMPLFVQENYAQKASVEQLAEAAEYISAGDLLSTRLNANYDMLPLYGVVSSVAPGAVVGKASGMVRFPAWLGKNSAGGKRARLMAELGRKVGGSAVREYVPALGQMLAAPLVARGKAGVEEVLAVMDSVGIDREDSLFIADSLPYSPAIPAATKSALTRAYNKNCKQKKQK